MRDGSGQLHLMPVDPRDWLPERHLAWSVLEQVGEMDLSAFDPGYRADGRGGQGYAPAMMTGLLLYRYYEGLRSQLLRISERDAWRRLPEETRRN